MISAPNSRALRSGQGEAAVLPDTRFCSVGRSGLIEGERAQFQQWLDSYCRVEGHEPPAQDIEDFMVRHHLLTLAGV